MKMTGEELQEALEELGMAQAEAARRLQVLRGQGQQRISDWVTGKRPVPPYIAAHVEDLLRLERAKAVLSAWVEAIDSAELDERISDLYFQTKEVVDDIRKEDER